MPALSPVERSGPETADRGEFFSLNTEVVGFPACVAGDSGRVSPGQVLMPLGYRPELKAGRKGMVLKLPRRRCMNAEGGKDRKVRQ